MYSVKIKNCKNIIDGCLEIAKGKLNIKYGINGTGKTTLAQAIQLSQSNNFDELQSYLTDNPAEVTLSEPLNKILVFDENFVNQIVFNDKEVINNTFEVFLKTDTYDEKKKQVDSHLEKLHKILSDEVNIGEFRELLLRIFQKFSLSNSGAPKQTGTYRSILAKTNLFCIPTELEDFREFIEDKTNAIQWIDWKKNGDKYDNKSRCPYCSEHINRTEQDKKKEAFSKAYNKSEAQNLSEILSLFDELKPYLVPDEYDKLIKYVKEDTAKEVVEALITKLLSEISFLIKLFNSIEEFGNRRIAIADINSLDEDIKKMSIPVDIFTVFGGSDIEAIWNPINDAVSHLEVEIGILKKELGDLKGVMQATINNSQRDINDFLRTAGINYELYIDAEDENNSRTKLKQCFTEGHTEVNEIRKHLSWGERNAFSLVLFMYYAVMQKPDLIILDDPISSFDSNKKYAILHRLFKGAGNRAISFENKTVLLLTHDFEPLVDFAIVGKIGKDKVATSFVWNNSGKLCEKEIIPEKDIKLILVQYDEIARNEKINIVPRVAALRLLSELNEKKGQWKNVYEILSSLIHGNEIKVKLGNGKKEEMPEDEIHAGLDFIRKYIPDFEYQNLKQTVYTVDGIKKLYSVETNDYFKVQLFREFKELDGGNNLKIKPSDEAWYKFIDETYHIENGNLYLLDVCNYNIVPPYIIKMVDDIMATIQ